MPAGGLRLRGIANDGAPDRTGSYWTTQTRLVLGIHLRQ